jgi:Domain of unknown function (DUF4129)
MMQDSGAQRSRAAAPRLGRVVAAALLIALVIAGIRGANPSVSFRGPWHDHGTLIGVALEVVLAALMFAVARRGAHAPAGVQPAARLRDWLRVALLLGLVLTPVSIAFTILAKVHTRTHAHPAPRPRLGRPRQGSGHGTAASGHAEVVILYGLLGAVLLAVIVACLIVLYKRRQLATRLRHGDDVPDDPQNELSRALRSGHTALRQVDDARAAIIACYVAMEHSLAEAGAARGDAETPDELLARAASAGLVHGQAAGQLTGLFYEARFSSHPLPASRKAAAEDALAALAAGPGAGTAGR